MLQQPLIVDKDVQVVFSTTTLCASAPRLSFNFARALNKFGNSGIAKRLQATHYFNTLSEDALMVRMWYLMDNHSRPYRGSVLRSGNSSVQLGL